MTYHWATRNRQGKCKWSERDSRYPTRVIAFTLRRESNPKKKKPTIVMPGSLPAYAPGKLTPEGEPLPPPLTLIWTQPMYYKRDQF